MISTILIIGGGQAGAQAIDTLRREGFRGRLVLIGDEPELPYQRPPLSKKYLSGEMAVDRFPFRHRAFYDEHRIELKLGRRAVRLDAAARQVRSRIHCRCLRLHSVLSELEIRRHHPDQKNELAQ